MTTSFSIKSLLASNTNVDLDDSMKTKITLRRLGYYKMPSYGMTSYPDAQLFDAVSDLQADNGIRRIGEIRPGDDTEKAINLALENTSPRASDRSEKSGKYIWRTRGDSKVRSEHAERDGKVFEWNNPPEGGHPGEAPNCRCRAESIKVNHLKCGELYRKTENARLEMEQKKLEWDIIKSERFGWERTYTERQRVLLEKVISLGLSGVPKTKEGLMKLLARVLSSAQLVIAFKEIEEAWDSMEEADRTRISLRSGVKILENSWQKAKREYADLVAEYDRDCMPGSR